LLSCLILWKSCSLQQQALPLVFFFVLGGWLGVRGFADLDAAPPSVAATSSLMPSETSRASVERARSRAAAFVAVLPKASLGPGSADTLL